MKRNKQTFLLSQDLYIRLVTSPGYNGNLPETAEHSIKMAATYFEVLDKKQALMSGGAREALNTPIADSG
jgi:hypothetical protein